jgi:hypothetical protein
MSDDALSLRAHPCPDSYCTSDASMPVAGAIPGPALGALAGWVAYRIAKSWYDYPRS